MSRLVKFAPALAALTFAFAASADGGLPKVVSNDKEKPEIGFAATGTGGLKINGTANDLQIFEKDGNVVFKVSLKGLKTGIDLRDGHTQKYLNTKEWPDASFSVPKAKFKPASGEVSGVLRIHGVDKPRTFKVNVKQDGTSYSVDTSFKVDIKDHKIEQPCYLGVCMKEEVMVNVKFKAKG